MASAKPWYLRKSFGLGLDDVLQGFGRLLVCCELLAGGPGHVPAVEGRFHQQHRAHVGGRGGVAHDVARAGPGFGIIPCTDGLAYLPGVVLAEAGVGGEVLVHQVLGDALAVRPALGGIRGPQDRVVEQGAQVPVAARGGCVQCFLGHVAHHAGRLGRRGRHLCAQILRLHGCDATEGGSGRLEETRQIRLIRCQMPPSGAWVVACSARTSPRLFSGSTGTSRRTRSRHSWTTTGSPAGTCVADRRTSRRFCRTRTCTWSSRRLGRGYSAWTGVCSPGRCPVSAWPSGYGSRPAASGRSGRRRSPS